MAFLTIYYNSISFHDTYFEGRILKIKLKASDRAITWQIFKKGPNYTFVLQNKTELLVVNSVLYLFYCYTIRKESNSIYLDAVLRIWLLRNLKLIIVDEGNCKKEKFPL